MRNQMQNQNSQHSPPLVFRTSSTVGRQNKQQLVIKVQVQAAKQLKFQYIWHSMK